MYKVGRIRRYFLIPRFFWWGRDNNNIVPVVESASAKRDDDFKEIVSANDSPRLSPILSIPITKRPVFPGFLAAINIKDAKTIDAIIANKATGHGYIGLFLRKDDLNVHDNLVDHITTDDAVYNTGTFVQVQSIDRTEVGTQIVIMAHRRITIESFLSLGPPAVAKVSHWSRPIVDVQSMNIKAYSNEVLQAARELLKINPLAQEHMQQWVTRMEFSDPLKLADFAASLTTASGPELQAVLEERHPQERLQLALSLLRKEMELAKLQHEIQKQVEEKITKQQREYFLREQLKNIKQELGIEKEDKDELLAGYKEKFESFNEKITADVSRVITDEMKKMASLERNSPEFNVTRSYLDWYASYTFRYFL